MYKVTKKYAKGPESQIGNFKTVQEAKKLIQTKLEEDALHKVQATYSLYEGFDLMETFDQSKLEVSSSDEGSGGSAGQPGSGHRNSPTPFATAPMPKGMPRSWGSKEEDQTKK